MNNPNLGGAEREEIGNTLEQQRDAMQKALNYPGRFAPPQPGVGTTSQDFERWADIDRVMNGRK